MAGRKIKILFLVDRLIPGGTENQLILLTEGLSCEKYDPTIGVLYKTEIQSSMQGKTPIVDFHWRGAPLLKSISLILRLRRYLEKERFDILQTHFVDSTIYGAWAVRLCRNRPYLITTRRNLYHWIEETPLSFRLLRHTTHWTDRILVNSHKVFEECQELEKIPFEKITLIHNGVELERFNGIPIDEAKKRIGLSGVYPVIGVVSNFRPVKGLLSFLQSAEKVHREIPSAVFVLVGRGPQEDELRKHCRELGIQNQVRFLVGYPDVSTAIAAFDVAVQPSLSESFSNVLLEYMGASRPIVATRAGDGEVIIQDGTDGLLVQPNDPQGLSSAILYLSRNRERAVKMGKRAREKATRDWSSEKIIRAHEELYERVIDDRH